MRAHKKDNRETGALDQSWFGQSGTAPATVIGKWLNDTTVSDHGKVSTRLQFHQSGDRPV
jgi:hypothetical protein